MTKARNGVDKNLQNVVDELDTVDLPAYTNNQINQHQNDRRHQDKLNVASQIHEAEHSNGQGERGNDKT
jgi:hypothetical protein